MKFAHLADTHLGYRQFGLFEREKDFYEVFEKTIDKIIQEKVDFVIHSGDLFDNSRPSPLALLTFQKGLLKLKNANIPIFAIAGNHDSVMRKGAIPPQVLFKKFGLKVISPINTNYMYEDVFIAGLPFYSSSQDKNLKNKLKELSKKAANHEKSILVLHQGIDKYFSLQYELEIGDVPDNFDYYAMGHLHNYINDDFGKGKLVYPGSCEVWKTTELGDYHKNGKGFVVVDLDGKKPSVTRIKVDLPRDFIERTIDYDNLADEVKSIRQTIKDLDKEPILNLTVNNVTSTSNAYEIINEELEDLALMIRPKFITPGEENIDLIIDKENALGPIEVLSSRLESYNDEDITNFAVELYELLSKDKNEEAKDLIDEFYKEKYPVEEDEED
jgi:DNA repair exonuclease SbcCD nuclease subunit